MNCKTCCRCQTEKPITEFYRDCTAKDGYCPSCKTCRYATPFNHSISKVKMGKGEHDKLADLLLNHPGLLGDIIKDEFTDDAKLKAQKTLEEHIYQRVGPAGFSRRSMC